MTTTEELVANAGRLELKLRVAELEAEVAFLLERADRASFWWVVEETRSIGISSTALVHFAFTGRQPDDSQFPRDPSDLASCYRALRRMPAHLRERVESSTVMERYRSAVEARYALDEMDAALAEEARPNG